MIKGFWPCIFFYFIFIWSEDVLIKFMPSDNKTQELDINELKLVDKTENSNFALRKIIKEQNGDEKKSNFLFRVGDEYLASNEYKINKSKENTNNKWNLVSLDESTFYIENEHGNCWYLTDKGILTLEQCPNASGVIDSRFKFSVLFRPTPDSISKCEVILKEYEEAMEKLNKSTHKKSENVPPPQKSDHLQSEPKIIDATSANHKNQKLPETNATHSNQSSDQLESQQPINTTPSSGFGEFDLTDAITDDQYNKAPQQTSQQQTNQQQTNQQQTNQQQPNQQKLNSPSTKSSPKPSNKTLETEKVKKDKQSTLKTNVHVNPIGAESKESKNESKESKNGSKSSGQQSNENFRTESPSRNSTDPARTNNNFTPKDDAKPSSADDTSLAATRVDSDQQSKDQKTKLWTEDKSNPDQHGTPNTPRSGETNDVLKQILSILQNDLKTV